MYAYEYMNHILFIAVPTQSYFALAIPTTLYVIAFGIAQY